ncbi:N-acetylmuramic acid 6-phosphate etherase [Glaciecola siphonariae]|uniref:N-acetylmuramic acid 6-phosphate etherase n=1 Tax=Glaciecola siphonariae TaxID=521012 RepID=A0ABV9LYR8_9ALTE
MQTSSSELIQQLDTLVSEGRNPDTMNLDTLSTSELLGVMNQEDRKVAQAVQDVLPDIAQAVEHIVNSLKQGGRLIYIGAGTSGRLGVLDAVECRPTFSVSDNLVVGIIAGGERALMHAVEGAEDNAQAGVDDLKSIDLSAKDTVVGIAASGRTPYVIGALNYANDLGCESICLVCNPTSPLLSTAKTGICVTVGPECLTGSTRMKSGTAQKLVLNMLSTAAMVKMGKVYENLMVDVNASNKKLEARAIRIVMQATQCSSAIAEQALVQAGHRAKLAILMILSNTSAQQAEKLLDDSQGFLRRALGAHSP